MTQTPWFTPIKNRGLIRLQGPDRHDFLQGLITSDVKALEMDRSVYGCLLNAQGKFLHDFFVIEQDQDCTVLDCEGNARALDLHKRLMMYRLRADVQISVEESSTIYAIFGAKHGLSDPRHADMGRRNFEKPDSLEERSFEEWDARRLSFAIPDGSRDLVPEKSTMDEGWMDQLHAINYDKGCYIGQELTARMHYRGLGKKHLYMVHPDDLSLKVFPPPFSEIKNGDKIVGEMRSSCGGIGLALLKDDYARSIGKNL